MATLKVTNQKPQVLSPHVMAPVKGPFDPRQHLIEMVARPLMTPISPTATAHITAGADLSEDDIADMLGACLSDVVDPVAEAAAKELLSKTMVHFPADTKLTVTNLFVTQSAAAAGLDEPDAQIIYTPAVDLIPASKGFIAGTASFDEWFASLAFCEHPDTLGFAFATEASFDAMRAWIAATVAQLASTLPPETVQAFDSFDKSCRLTGLTESLWLRKSAQDGNDEYSFARMLPNMVMQYVSSVAPNESWCCPFSLDRLLIPETIVFVNVEAHARSTARQITNEWNLIEDAISDDIRVLKPGQVQKLTAARRAAQKAAAAATAAAAKGANQTTRALNIKFKKTPPTATDIVRLISKILSRLAYVNHSQNVYKNTKMSFARPNRRDPDDFNRQGKVVSTKYRPDIHLYVDTSGSISETQYQDAVKACIMLARKLDINLYFNSFSHVMTESVMLPTKGRSAKQIWKQVQRIPKVSGGTDYQQIWRYVQSSKKRQRELSLVITDFEYWPPNHHVDHPKNLYYLPISHSSWEQLVSEAARFSNSMGHIFPQIRTHILL